MTYAAPFALAVAALAGIGLAIKTVDGPDTPKPGKKDKYAAAVDTLEQQLQRRFHDRNNVTFGYERVIRAGSRRHNTVVLDIMSGKPYVNDDGQPLTSRPMEGGGYEFEVASGVWVPSQKIKQTMHAENEDEKNLMAVLREKQVAIYTAGVFDEKTGEAIRVKGPAYLRYNTPDAPTKEEVAGFAARGWKTRNEADELRQGGWSFRVVKVKADDESCVQCHTDILSGGIGKDRSIKPYHLNEPVGVFIIGTKLK